MKRVEKKGNVIAISGDMDQFALTQIHGHIEEIRENNFDEVIFAISSAGGGTEIVLNLIETLKKMLLKTACVVKLAGSAAAIFAISCKERAITREGIISLHAVEWTVPITAIPDNGKIPCESLQKGRALQKKCEDIILARTKITSYEIREIMAPGASAQFTAEAALKMGLVDVILP